MCPDDNLLSAHVLGLLDRDVSAQIAAHVDECDRCLRCLVDLAHVMDPTDGSPPPAVESIPPAGHVEPEGRRVTIAFGTALAILGAAGGLVLLAPNLGPPARTGAPPMEGTIAAPPTPPSLPATAEAALAVPPEDDVASHAAPRASAVDDLAEHAASARDDVASHAAPRASAVEDLAEHAASARDDDAATATGPGDGGPTTPAIAIDDPCSALEAQVTDPCTDATCRNLQWRVAHCYEASVRCGAYQRWVAHIAQTNPSVTLQDASSASALCPPEERHARIRHFARFGAMELHADVGSCLAVGEDARRYAGTTGLDPAVREQLWALQLSTVSLLAHVHDAPELARAEAARGATAFDRPIDAEGLISP